jgi:hypothetical protein
MVHLTQKYIGKISTKEVYTFTKEEGATTP